MDLDFTRSEVSIFKYLWSISNKRSFLSELHLRDFEGTPYWFSLFAHILPKARNKYPYFKHYFGNIKLLTPGEHHLLDQGTKDQRISYSKEVKTADWSRIDQLREDLEVLYKEKFPYTYHGIIGYRFDEDEVRVIISQMNAAWLAEYQLASGVVNIGGKKQRRGK